MYTLYLYRAAASTCMRNAIFFFGVKKAVLLLSNVRPTPSRSRAQTISSRAAVVGICWMQRSAEQVQHIFARVCTTASTL